MYITSNLTDVLILRLLVMALIFRLTKGLLRSSTRSQDIEKSKSSPTPG